MESPTTPPSSTPPQQPPGIKPGGESSGGTQSGMNTGEMVGAGNGISPRAMPRYPKPPALLVRFLGLCLRPESWAETARYPTYVTLVPLILAILIGASLTAGAGVSHVIDSLRTFASHYEARGYPPLELTSDGDLQVKGELKNPIRVEMPGSLIFIDPTGKTTPASIKEMGAILVTGDQVIILGDQAPLWSYSLPHILADASIVSLPPAGQSKLIDGPVMTHFIDNHAGLFELMGFTSALLMALGDAVWAGIMMFFLCPIIMLATAGPRFHTEGPEKRLMLPRRAAYRMAAGLLVPLIMLDAVLNFLGHPVWALLGGQGTMIFWFFVAGALGVWTGIMAKRMYGPVVRRRA